MLYFGCGYCQNLNRESGVPRCSAFPDGIPLSIVSGNIYHTIPMFEQQNDIVYEPKKEADYSLVIENSGRFPESTFLDPKDYEQIGIMSSGNAIVVVGYEDGDEDTPLVAQATLSSSEREETVTVAPLYSMMSMMPNDVELIDFTENSGSVKAHSL